METCYKVFEKSLIKSIKLNSNSFNIEPEITAKILKLGVKIKEIPISYNPRTIEEGKKINWKDGLQAIWTLVYWRFKNVHSFIKITLPNRKAAADITKATEN